MTKKISKMLKKFKNPIMFIIGLGILLLAIFIIWVATLRLPDFKNFTERRMESSTKIYDKTGTILLYDVHQEIKRTIVPYEQIGVDVKNATVAIEDSEFYNHKGIRIKAIIRAVWANITGGKVQGGSTITQQLIKNTLLTPEKSVTRKIKEWILAIKVERILDKEEILALYLNEAPYGGNIYGIEEASKTFFNKNASNLTLAESAYLAAIPNGPTYYSPYGKNKNKLDERKNLVLKRMLDLNFITKEKYEEAKNEKVTFLQYQPMHIAAPHFVFFVREYLEQKYGTEIVNIGGLKVITTLDYELQKKAEEIALEKAKENETNWNGKNTAIVVIDPKTGQILAMVGSRNYFDKTVDGNFNVATAERQPGSSFKPIVYALAFKKGYTEKTVLFDLKTEFNPSCSPEANQTKSPSGGDCYSPENYDNGYRGPMSLRNALAQSINVVAVKLLYLVGVKDSIKMAHDLGVTTLNDPDRYGLSLVIGGGETTLLDMTSVYSVFANEGIRNPYQSILSVEDPNGEILEKFEDKSFKVIEPNITRIISSILSDEQARIPTFGAGSVLNIPGRQVAVKTGTTNNNRDAWTIGYTPSVAVGVWVGNNDNTPMKKGGAALAGPIWNAVMSEALNKMPVELFNTPNEIDNGLPNVIRGFWQGNEPGGAHTILHWINKNDPTNLKTIPGNGDSQYTNWEYSVAKWWWQNKYSYTNIPQETQNLFNIFNNSKPNINIVGFENKIYGKEEQITIPISITSINPIKKVDVFINNKYYISLKTEPYNINLIPKNIDGLKNKNEIKIIAYDTAGKSDEKKFDLKVNTN